MRPATEPPRRSGVPVLGWGLSARGEFLYRFCAQTLQELREGHRIGSGLSNPTTSPTGSTARSSTRHNGTGDNLLRGCECSARLPVSGHRGIRQAIHDRAVAQSWKETDVHTGD